MGLLSFDKLKEKAQTPIKVEIPELGGWVFLRPLTPKLAKSVSTGEGFDYAARLVESLVCDEHGNQLLTAEQVDEIPADVIAKLVDAITKASLPENPTSAQPK